MKSEQDILDMFNKSRDPARIDDFIYELGRLWKQAPDMRFFQLVAAISGQHDQFYTEDAEALKLIQNTKYWMALHD